jgi:endonuclease/exonuclease/phosphatase family metal-dependent hydrolase
LTSFLTYAPQQFWFGFSSLLLVTSLQLRDRKALALNCIALLFVIFTFQGFNIPWGRTEQSVTQPTRLRVMTFNIEYGAHGIEQIAKVIRQQQPEVLCLQETRGFHTFPDPVPALVRVLNRQNPGWYMVRTHEVTTMSRYPIRSQRVHVMPPPSKRALLETSVNVRGRVFTVFNAHISMEAADRADRARMRALPRLLQLGGSSVMRQKQVNLVLNATKAVGTPFAVCGDFNIPPRGLIYRSLASNLTDSFRAAGWGSGLSFRSDLPLLRIDYIWMSRNVGATNAHVPSVRASDHRPYVADLVF